MAGSIQQRGPDTFLITISAGFDAAGKRIRVTRTIHGSPDDAEVEKATMQRAVNQDADKLTPKAITFRLFAVMLNDSRVQDVAERTTDYYRYVLDRYLKDAFGSTVLRDITAGSIARFYASDKLKHLSASTRLKIHRALSFFLQHAVYQGYLDSNPAKAVPAPRVPQYRAERFLEPHHARTLLAALPKASVRLRAFITLALTTGLSRGELLGLEWRHIDLQAATVTVDQTAQCRGTQKLRAQTKTQTRRRIVSLPALAVTALQEWQDEQQRQREAAKRWKAPKGLDLVWTDHDGSWYYADQATKDVSAFLQTVEGLPKVTLHSLRHTVATLLISEGMDVTSVSAVLGHARTSTTLNIYSHAADTARNKAADTLQNVLLSTDSVNKPHNSR